MTQVEKNSIQFHVQFLQKCKENFFYFEPFPYEYIFNWIILCLVKVKVNLVCNCFYFDCVSMHFIWRRETEYKPFGIRQGKNIRVKLNLRNNWKSNTPTRNFQYLSYSNRNIVFQKFGSYVKTSYSPTWFKIFSSKIGLHFPRYLRFIFQSLTSSEMF